MSSAHAQRQVELAQRMLDRWSGGDAELWQHRRAHRGIVLRLANESQPGCLLVYLGDVERYCGPLRWQASRILLSAETDPRTGDDVYVAFDAAAGLDVRCRVVETKPMNSAYPE